MYTGVCARYDNSFYIARTVRIIQVYTILTILLLFKPISSDFNSGYTLIGRVPNISPTSTGMVSANQISSLALLNKSNIDIVVTMTGTKGFSLVVELCSNSN